MSVGISNEFKSTIAQISNLLKIEDATIVAHYYTPAEIQVLADESGGFVGDSLAMAQFGFEQSASTLVVSGVRFMGETAKILSPNKRILMPTTEATCSLDLGCPIDQFSQFCNSNPDRIIVVYCNTSASVKACADWVVTSSNALAIITYLEKKNKKILWAPDRYLGNYLREKTGADMILWEGTCIVHEEFKGEALTELRQKYPHAAVLVHPESPSSVVRQATVVGSTAQLLKALQELPNDTFIIATDRGIFYKMQQLSPNKTFIEAPTAGHGATCQSCGHCPWMAMNNLQNLKQSLMTGSNEVILDSEVIAKAKIPLQRMLNFNYTSH